MKKLYCGRSMVEMLGVLAIIGVLSIGGVSAYRLAMNRLKLNAVKSWIAGAEFAIHENCFLTDSNNCQGSGTDSYIKRRDMLCNAMGADYCSSNNHQAYAPFPIIPNIEWTTEVYENAWLISFTQLTESQCDLFVQMALPKNVIYVRGNAEVVNFSTKPPTLTASQITRLSNSCKTGVKSNTTYGGVFMLKFSID